jgi:hypothetical protein
METRALPTNEQLEFLRIVTTGKVLNMKDFLAKHPDVDVNYVDEATGRSTLHLAPTQVMYDALIESGCDSNPNIVDLGGFTPVDLMLNYYQYQEAFHFDYQKVLIRYYKFWISEFNSKLPANTCLEYMHTMEGVNNFLAANPHLTKIGFIVKKPNCLRTLAQFDNNVIRDFHLSSMYFERTRTGEVIVQIDSVMGAIYSFPTLPGTNRVQYYCALHRQADNAGCFEDALVLLYKVLIQPDFNLVQFCQKNSTRDLAVTQNLTKPDRAKYKELHDKQMCGTLNEADVQIFPQLRRRHDHEKLTRLYQNYGMNTLKYIYQFSALPAFLLLHINFYRTIREIRLKDPKLFTQKLDPSDPKSPSVLDKILQQGKIRDSSKTPTVIKKNLSNPSEFFDFKNRDFADRESVFKEQFYRYDRVAYNLFYRKLSALEQKANFKDEKQSANLARKVTFFLTGSLDYTDDIPKTRLRR